MARPSKWLKALIQPLLKTDVPLTIKLASGQTANAIEVKTSADATVFSVSAAGAMTPAVNSYVDNVFELKDNGDATKKATFQCSGITAGQTRVMTFPDFNGTLATLAGTETLTGKTLTAPKITSASHLADANGAELVKFPAAVADAVNEVTVTNAISGAAPSIAATGDDAAIGLTVAAKGTGTVNLGQATSTGVKLVADQPILDSAGLELLKFTKTATAVNELTVANAATGGSPSVSATGDDANISVKLASKGTGRIVPTVGGLVNFYTVTSKAEASDQTYTAAQVLGGMILRDCNGAHRADTLPTAALLVAAVPGAVVGTGFEFTIQNFSNAAETITVGVGAGGTADPTSTLTIAQSNTKRFLIVFTNVTGAAEAYTLYSLGTVTH